MAAKRSRRVLVVISVLVVLFMLPLGVWGFRDESLHSIGPFGRVRLAEEAHGDGVSGLSASAELLATARAVAKLRTKEGRSLLELSSLAGEENLSAFAAHSQLDDLSRQLQHALAELPPVRSRQDRFGSSVSFRPLLNVTKILVLQIRTQLRAGLPEQAWATVELVQSLVAASYQRTSSLLQLAALHSSQAALVAEIVDGADRGLWPERQQESMLTWQPSSAVSDGLRVAILSEYGLTKKAITGELQGYGAVIGSYVYHPNRTANIWRRSLGKAMAGLESDSLAQAYRDVVAYDGIVSDVDMLLGRNGLGIRYSALGLTACDVAMANAIQAAVRERIIPLRAAFALFRQRKGRWPQSLENLQEEYPQVSVSDPWSVAGQALHFDVVKRQVYSLGFNRRDDGGVTENFGAVGATDDYGIVLPP